MTNKEIEGYRIELADIVGMSPKIDGNPPEGQKEKLQELAKKVGASIRGTYIGEKGKEVGCSASISDLISNIHQALQTATFINTCKTASRSWVIAIIAVIVSMGGVFAAWKANKLTSASLQNSYMPWLRIMSVEPLVIDSNNIEIKYVCKNFANGGPALNLDITITVFGKSTTKKLYDSNVLMPNDQSSFSAYVDTHGTYQPKDLVERLKIGESPIIFDICFEDIFGRKIKVHQGYKSIERVFRMTEYKVDGLE